MTFRRWMIASGALVGALHAQAIGIYEESFDYGESTVVISDVGTWDSASTKLKYDHDGGLDHPQLAGETGGAMWLDYNDARSASDSSINYPLSTLSEGDAIWVAVLFQYVGSNNTHSLSISGGAVSGLAFAITSGGDVIVTCARKGNNNDGVGNNDTGIDVGSGTYLMLLRATKGTGASPTDSTVDFWLDPADTSSEGVLGAPHWSTDASGGSKWGRDTDSLTGISAQPSQQGRIDEIRIATDFATVTGGVLPPPPPGAVVVIK